VVWPDIANNHGNLHLMIGVFTIMRIAAALILLASSLTGAQAAPSRLEMPLRERLDAPQRIAAASVRLTNFAGFIATSFKVPLLVETTSPVPDLKIPAGTYSPRQLLDSAVRQLHGFAWRDEDGVAHLYNRQLVKSPGNILNVRIHRFSFPGNVAEFLYDFRPCISGTIQGYGCAGGMAGILPADLERESLPKFTTFKDVSARAILLAALKENGRFYVLIAFESPQPKLTSDYPYLNWFSQSLVPTEPAPMWVQTPKKNR
jgi:hypothetical protein